MKETKFYFYVTAAALLLMLLIVSSCDLLGLGDDKKTKPDSGDIAFKFYNPSAGSYTEDNYVEGDSTLTVKDGFIESYDYLVRFGSSSGSYYARKMRISVQDNKNARDIFGVNTITWETQSFSLANFDDPIYDFDPSSDDYRMVKVDYFYNSNEMMASLNFYVYNPNDDTWSDSGEDAFTYDSNGRLKLIREADRYDGNNNPIYYLAMYFKYDNPNFPNFHTEEWEFYTDDDNDPSLETDYDFEGDPDGYFSSKVRYSYVTDPDTGKITTRVKQSYDSSDDTWYNSRKISVSYDNNDNISQVVLWSWDSSAETWVISQQVDVNGVPSGVDFDFEVLFSYPWKYILGFAN